MRWFDLMALVIGGILASGCSEYGYRFHPRPQTWQAPIFADYALHEKTVDVMVDTDGLALSQIDISKPDGTAVKPLAIDYPPTVQKLMGGTQDEIYGPETADGPTVAHFDRQAIGASPWDVHVKIQSLPYETIRVGK